MNITGKQILKYSFLPGFWPRLNELIASGFRYIPYFIASVYSAVKLLPPGHPYMNTSNIGKFGIRHVITEAANNLTFSKDHIDQVILFFTIIIGMVLIVLQFGFFAIIMIAQPAFATAMPTNFAEFFLLDRPQDISFIMLDMVFGVPDLFNSCIQTNSCVDIENREIVSTVEGVNWNYQAQGNFPFPVHYGLHQLFQVYSLGLLVVGAFISIYFIMTVIAETAQSGTPFGKRFNKVWAPIRIVVAFGLLIPIGNVGLNSSQYIVLYAAKYGAGFANKGWDIFTSRLPNVHGMAQEELVAEPNQPDPTSFLQFLFTAKTCQAAENAIQSVPETTSRKADIEPYAVRGQLSEQANLIITPGTGYPAIIDFAQGESQVVIRFGRNDPQDNASFAGFVAPTCGEFVLVFSDSRTDGEIDPGVALLQQHYFEQFKSLWFDRLEVDPGPIAYARNNIRIDGFHTNDTTLLPESNYKSLLLTEIKQENREVAQEAILAMQESNRFQMSPIILDKGWACAACMYNRIAEMNGLMVSSILNQPMQTRYAEVMETIHLEKRKAQKNVTFSERFKPAELPGEVTEKSKLSIDKQIALALWESYHFWDEEASSPHRQLSGNVIIDTINALMGTEGIFNMRRNADIHPIAQIASAGKSMVEASIRNLTYAVVAGGTGLAGKMLDPFIGASASISADFLITIAMVTLTAGFVLFYIVPFLPFIYFFFAFGGWVKGIFEAMVGAPLWALGHLRIDGNGLSGQAALSGYYLIFEIFLRPILMIFGLIASITIFSAMVKVLNMIFELVVANFGGFDLQAEYAIGTGASPESQMALMRGSIDEFFFTIIYVIIVYMMGMSSFKLVDLIPNNILRWMGQSVATFGDQREDPTQKLVSTSTVGSQQATSAIGGGLSQLAKLGR